MFNLLQYRFAYSVIGSQVLSFAGSPTLLSILGSHMMFSLREAAEHGVNIGTNYWTVELSERSTLTDMTFTWGRAPATSEYMTSPVSPTEKVEGGNSDVKGKAVDRNPASPA